jgi:hypothetical protein
VSRAFVAIHIGKHPVLVPRPSTTLRHVTATGSKVRVQPQDSILFHGELLAWEMQPSANLRTGGVTASTNMFTFCISNRLFSSRICNRYFSLLTKSFVQGPSTPPLSSQTLPEFFYNQILPSYGERPALISLHEPPRVHGGPPPLSSSLHMRSTSRNYLEWNYGEFDRQIQALAKGLIGLGVKKGERVGVIMGNSRFVSWGALIREYSLYFQCVCHVAMGMRERRSHLGDH